MPHPENSLGPFLPEKPLPPGALPSELAEYLKEQETACLMQETNLGTVFVIKLPRHEIEAVRGSVPIRQRHELYEHPAAPVIRTLLTIYDQPETPLALETFTNIGDPQQRADFAALERQRHTPLLFYNEHLALRLTKQVPSPDPITVRRILRDAERFRARIAPGRFDFDAAKAAVIEATSL